MYTVISLSIKVLLVCLLTCRLTTLTFSNVYSCILYILSDGGVVGGSSVIERRSLTVELSLVCNGPAADG